MSGPARCLNTPPVLTTPRDWRLATWLNRRITEANRARNALNEGVLGGEVTALPGTGSGC
jgi:hypothetical protein